MNVTLARELSPDHCGWKPGEVLRTRGAVQAGGLTGRFQRRVQAGTGREVLTIDLGVVTSGRGFDGQLAWLKDSSGAVHDIDSSFARAVALSQAWLDGRQGCLGPTGASAAEISEASEDGKIFRIWRTSPPSGAPIELWYDASQHLDRAILQLPETRLIRHFSNWRDVGHGHWVAFMQRDEYPEDEDVTIFTVTHASVSRGVTAADFQRPSQPHDAEILRGQDVTTVSYEDDHRTRIYLPVFINGYGPFTFELDSGGHFIVDANTAAAAHLESTGSFNQTGAGQEISQAGYAPVRELRIGDAVIRDQVTKVRALSAEANNRGPRMPRAGILGLELFERFTVSIDRGRKTVSLRLRGQTYPTPRGVALPIVFAEDAPLISGAFADHRGDFMLDTGNAGPTIIEDFWARPLGLAQSLSAGLAVGDAKVSSGNIDLGSLSLLDETISYYGTVARGSEYTRAVAGVLGEPLLSRLNATYDYDQKIVWLETVADAAPLPFNRSGLSLAATADRGFRVAGVVAASPAAEAQVQVNDWVTDIDGQPARTLSRADAIAFFQQPEGTLVTLQLSNDDGRATVVHLRLRDLLPSVR